MRQTGHVNKKVATPKNYRHDENILAAKPTGYRQITLKDRCAQEFVTDDGFIIPTISTEIRTRIQLQAEMFGLDWIRQCDMMSRCTVELCLQMLGGARRLSLKNQHQWPKIAIICDEMSNERFSEIGFVTGRQLAAQGLQVHILVKPNLNAALKSNRDAELFKATGNVITMSVDGTYSISVGSGEIAANKGIICMFANTQFALVLFVVRVCVRVCIHICFIRFLLFFFHLVCIIYRNAVM